MAEKTQSSSADQSEDYAVLALQELEGADEQPEVEAHLDGSGVSILVCQAPR